MGNSVMVAQVFLVHLVGVRTPVPQFLPQYMIPGIIHRSS